MTVGRASQITIMTRPRNQERPLKRSDLRFGKQKQKQKKPGNEEEAAPSAGQQNIENREPDFQALIFWKSWGWGWSCREAFLELLEPQYLLLEEHWPPLLHPPLQKGASSGLRVASFLRHLHAFLNSV